MAIAIRAVGPPAYRENYSETCVLTKPTGVQQGDVLLAFINVDGPHDCSAPSGWARFLLNDLRQQSFTAYGFYRIVTNAGTEPSDYTWTTSGITAWSGQIIAASGVDTASTIVHGLINNKSSTTGHVATTAAYTPSTDGAFPIAIVGRGGDRNATVSGTGWALDGDVPLGQGISIAHLGTATTANVAVTPATFTMTGSSTDWVASIFALIPLIDNGPPPTYSDVTHVGTTTSVASTGGKVSSISVALPTGAQTGDLLIFAAVVHIDSSNYPSLSWSDGGLVPLSPTIDDVSTQAFGNRGLRAALWFKTATASEPSSYTLTSSNMTTRPSVTCSAYRSSTGAISINAHSECTEPVQTVAEAPLSHATSSITTTTQAVIFGAWGEFYYDSGSEALTNSWPTVPSGWTKRGETSHGGGGENATETSLVVADYLTPGTPGIYGPYTAATSVQPTPTAVGFLVAITLAIEQEEPGTGAVSHVASAFSPPRNTTGASGYTCAVDRPSGVQEGDLLVFAASTRIDEGTVPSLSWDDASLSPLTGYIDDSSTNDNWIGNGVRARIWTKFATASEPSSYTLTATGTTTRFGLGCSAYRSNTGEIEVETFSSKIHPGTNEATGSTSHATDTVTVASSTAILYGAWAELTFTDSGNLPTPVWTAPATWTARGQTSNGGGNVTDTEVSLLVADNGPTSVTAGSQGPFTATTAGSTNTSVSFLIAIKAVEGEPPPPPPGDAELPDSVPVGGGSLNWIWVGHASSTSCLVSTRTTSANQVRLEVGTDVAITQNVKKTQIVTPNGNGLVKHEITGLVPLTQYYFKVNVGGTLATNRTGKFRTYPLEGSQSSFTFCFSADRYLREGLDPPIANNVMARNPLFFVWCGDQPQDSPSSYSVSGCLEEYEEAPERDVIGRIYRENPCHYLFGDHNFTGNNSYGWTGSDVSSNGKAMNNVYRMAIPAILASTTAYGIWHSFVVGRVRMIVLDERTYRVNLSSTDNSSKTMLGSVQKAWLKEQLLMPEPVKFIFQHVGWVVERGGSSPDWWNLYHTERLEIANFIKANNVRALWMHGDQHCASADDGTSENNFSGSPTLSASSFWGSDGGSIKGGPFSEGYVLDGPHYGQVTVTDAGTSISFQFTPWKYTSSGDTAVSCDLSYTWPNITPPSPANDDALVNPVRVSCQAAVPQVAVSATTGPGTISALVNPPRLYLFAMVPRPTNINANQHSFVAATGIWALATVPRPTIYHPFDAYISPPRLNCTAGLPPPEPQIPYGGMPASLSVTLLPVQTADWVYAKPYCLVCRAEVYPPKVTGSSNQRTRVGVPEPLRCRTTVPAPFVNRPEGSDGGMFGVQARGQVMAPAVHTASVVSRLSWEPPAMLNPTTLIFSNEHYFFSLDSSRDYVLKIPQILTVPIGFEGGRNVVLIAGDIYMPRDGAGNETLWEDVYEESYGNFYGRPTVPDPSSIPPGVPKRALQILGNGEASSTPRTIHIEGLLLRGGLTDGILIDLRSDSNVIVQIQNVRFPEVISDTSAVGATGDVIRVQGHHPKELRVDRLTALSTQIGIYLGAATTEMMVTRHILRRINLAANPTNGSWMYYLAPSSTPSGIIPITVDSCYALPRTGQSWPSQALSPTTVWANVVQGRPASDFARSGPSTLDVPGVNYISPGYGSEGVPPPINQTPSALYRMDLAAAIPAPTVTTDSTSSDCADLLGLVSAYQSGPTATNLLARTNKVALNTGAVRANRYSVYQNATPGEDFVLDLRNVTHHWNARNRPIGDGDFNLAIGTGSRSLYSEAPSHPTVPAIIGSTACTPEDQVGIIQALEETTTISGTTHHYVGYPDADDPYDATFTQYTNTSRTVDGKSDPWDTNQIRCSVQDGSYYIVDGVHFINSVDGLQGAHPGTSTPRNAYEVRNCFFQYVHHEVQAENDTMAGGLYYNNYIWNFYLLARFVPEDGDVPANSGAELIVDKCVLFQGRELKDSRDGGMRTYDGRSHGPLIEWSGGNIPKVTFRDTVVFIQGRPFEGLSSLCLPPGSKAYNSTVIYMDMGQNSGDKIPTSNFDYSEGISLESAGFTIQYAGSNMNHSSIQNTYVPALQRWIAQHPQFRARALATAPTSWGLT